MSDAGENAGIVTLPVEPIPERLTDEQRQAIQKDRSNAFQPPASSINIPMLDGTKNWDLWYNSMLVNNDPFQCKDVHAVGGAKHRYCFASSQRPKKQHRE